MRITTVRLRRFRGTMETDGPLWEERLVRPIDIYPEYRARQDFEGGTQVDPRHFRFEQHFLEIQTDAGVTGTAGPLQEPVAYFIGRRLRPILMGQDPTATEKLWDQMHRIMVHGRQGDAMLAISAVDCALWDLKGRWLGQPVYRLLGGPTRDRMPLYASMLGFDVLDMGRVRGRAQEYRDRGFRAQKWFFRHGPMSGPEGMRKNVDLVRTLREALGEDADIMLDCWQAFDPGYAIDLAERIEEYRPRWLEECVMPDRIDSYVRVKESTQHPAGRRGARIHALGLQAVHRRPGARYPATGHLLGRRAQRNAEDRGLCVSPRSDRHSAQRLDPGQLALLARDVAGHDAAPGIPGQVEPDQPAFPRP